MEHRQAATAPAGEFAARKPIARLRPFSGQPMRSASNASARHRVCLEQVTEYFNNRKEGPKPNKSAAGAQPAKAEGDDVWTAQRKSLSRPVRSFLGYHCGRPDYRASCKVAFRLWGDTLRATQLQILNKKLREQQEAAKAAMAASREATQKRTRGKRKAMRERKAAAKALAA